MIIRTRYQWRDEWLDFKPSEFYCRHCLAEGRMYLRIQEKVLENIQAMRTRLQFPFPITDATRCDQHPRVLAKIKKYGRGGAHHAGAAVDIAVYNEDRFWEIYHLAKLMGVRGIGNGLNFERGGFIHLDWWDARSKTRVEEWGY